jgi:hypothetical protein
MEISEKQASGIESKSISPDETELLNYTRQSPSAPFPRSREFQAHPLRVDIMAMPIPIHKVSQLSCARFPVSFVRENEPFSPLLSI